MTDLLLRRLVRDVLGESDKADPGELAELVLAQIPKSQMREALSQTLRMYVRTVISETRIGGNAALPAQFGSAKVTAIRDGWQRRLRDRVHGVDGWKMVTLCTYDDLMAAAAERRDIAERNVAWAIVYESWASLLTEYDVETFGDLPVEAQAAALGRAA